MRLFIALLFSAAVHIAAVFLISEHALKISASSAAPAVLSVSIQPHKTARTIRANIPRPSLKAAHSNALEETPNNGFANPMADTEPERKAQASDNIAHLEISALDETPNDTFADYIPDAELEVKALPRSNIDNSALKDVFDSGLPIKLRLYINSAGRVIKIEKLEVLAQDQPMQDALAKILINMSFIPAEKNGIPVNTYQDIALTFK
jgi:hypothetical protein